MGFADRKKWNTKRTYISCSRELSILDTTHPRHRDFQTSAMFSTNTFRRVSRLTQCTRSIQSASTVNAAEVAHFSRLSSQWWDENGEFALLHRMNPVRAQYLCDKVIEVAREERGEDVALKMEQKGVLRGMNVLDVGCGGGLLSEVGFLTPA